MQEEIIITDYKRDMELKWLDVHASVMVDSYAWWTVIHKKPTYEKPIIDLVALMSNKLVGFITIEINSDIIKHHRDMGFVWEFGVHRDYRGKNIGRLLINKAHERMKKKFSINKSIWYSQDKNAQSYYEKIGMKEIDRHCQLSIYPSDKQKSNLRKNGFECWEMRGQCSIEEYSKVKQNYNVIQDDDPLNPRICIGYELIL